MVTNPFPDQADRDLIAALTDHIDTVAEGIRSQAAQHSEVAKTRLSRMAEEYADSDLLAQAMIADALADFERVPEFFAAVARYALEQKLEPLRPSEPEEVVIEGTCVVVESEADEKEAQDRSD